jgi:multimeric flavodoxin WrbA
MKVIAINSSPRMDKGNTSVILTPFLKGMQDAGAEVELFYSRKLDIQPCQSCFTCWMKTPGKCRQDDDMQMLLPKISEADIWVIATPVYTDGMTGPMKNLIDRLIPLIVPQMEIVNGHCRHPIRDGVKKGKLVLVSNCGFWEMDNFNSLVTHVKTLCANFDREFAGALLRPYGSILKTMEKEGEPQSLIIEAAEKAGQELIRDGRISNISIDTIAGQIVSQEEFVEKYNKMIENIFKNTKK